MKRVNSCIVCGRPRCIIYNENEKKIIGWCFRMSKWYIYFKNNGKLFIKNSNKSKYMELEEDYIINYFISSSKKNKKKKKVDDNLTFF